MYKRNGWEEGTGNEADVALRKGLRALPVPDASADFDARVHAALRPPIPWQRTLWKETRPLLAMAACSFLLTFALLNVFATTSKAAPSLSPVAGEDADVASGIRERMDALDGNGSNALAAAPLTGFFTLHRSHRLTN